MIPIPVETDAMLAILNLPKEMSNNGIFKEHQGLVLEMIHSLVLQEHYDRATHEDLPEEEPILVSFRFGFSFLMLHSTAEFLNPDGLDRLNELKPRQARPIRVGVI